MVIHMALEAIITIVLVFFAYIMRTGNPALGGMVVGVAAAHWLKESSSVGRSIANGMPPRPPEEAKKV